MTIKSFELEPTKENIIRTLEEDLLGRNKDVWAFARLCSNQERRCSIAIDSKWGNGKTFFVKQVMALLDALNETSTSLSAEEKAWDGWINRMEANRLIRSMSKKACSPDNSACEGFFGRMKNEFFYGRDWLDISIESFIGKLNEYMIWYRDERIKESLGNLSPMQYRVKMGWVQS